MRLIQRKPLIGSFLLLTLVPMAQAQSTIGQGSWVGSWAASQQIPEPQNALALEDLRDATLRQIVLLSVGGAVLRVHLSNAFGTAPLHFTSVHVARPVSAGAAKIDPASDKALSFSGSSDVTVPAGAEYISDPLSQESKSVRQQRQKTRQELENPR